ncbi:MAG: glycosyltransferase, partial [Candidatus Omnitrophica bacterium]|nr:glycosyltransferase [Candidatus Omnitrophota bacterium]
MQNNIDVSVVIPVYDNKIGLMRCLLSLSGQRYPKDNYEVIVVDDGSRDGLNECIEEQRKHYLLELKYIYQCHKGPAAARNAGIAKAQGKIVVFTDSDCVAKESWLEEVIKGYYDIRVAGVGGVIKANPTSSIISQYCAYVKMNEEPKIDTSGIVYLITGNASFKKECLESVGGFDERYSFPGGEDPDLCYRLKQNGYIFQCNRNAVVYNSHKETLKSLSLSYFCYGKGESYLNLRKMYSWDFNSVKGFRRFLTFFISIYRILIVSFKALTLFLKLPFFILYYHREGLMARQSCSYALLDYIKNLSFIFGYMIGRLKWFDEN